MTVSAEILADSRHPNGSRLTTMRLRYPRFVHSEVMTHRAFARNASSSRAIPSKRMRADIRKDPALPLTFGENRPGMQQGADLPRLRALLARALWLGCMHVALAVSAALDALGCHKQIVNRVVEPWSHITVILTGNDRAFANFYALRRHKDAEPTIHALADAMAAAQRASYPTLLRIGDWHIPLVGDMCGRLALNEEIDLGDAVDLARGQVPNAFAPQLCKHSVARCARVSYNKPDTGKPPTYTEDLQLYERLVGSAPMHASPAEHQARASDVGGLGGCLGDDWVQYRKLLKGEVFEDLEEALR